MRTLAWVTLIGTSVMLLLAIACTLFVSPDAINAVLGIAIAGIPITAAWFWIDWWERRNT